jgi:hypothetical protein
MNLNTPLKFGDTIYDGNIYVSPKGTVTFGQGDYTYWDYPQTPSISIASFDYHAFANGVLWGADNNLYVKYGSTATSICIDWKVMLWGQSTGDPIYIRLIAYVDPETYTWEPVYQVSSNAPEGARYGVRYEYGGEVLPLTVQTITEAPEPEPTITPTPETTTEPEPEPTESEAPSTDEPYEPTDPPVDADYPLEPEPQESETPEPSTQTPEVIVPPLNPPRLPDLSQEVEPTQPTATPTQQPEPILQETPVEIQPSLEPALEIEPETSVALEEETEVLPVGFVLLENGVVLEERVVDALNLFNNPLELFSTLLVDPSKVLLALSNLGADMSPEVRETSQKVVVTAIIVSQIIGMSVASAIAAGRKP